MPYAPDGMLARLFLAVLTLAVMLAPSAVQARPGADERWLVELRPPETAALIARGLDLWEASPDRALALLTPEQAWALQAEGSDVQIVRVFPSGRRAAAATFGPGSYKGYAAIVAELRAIAAARPDIVSLHELGPSWETARGLADRPILAARVTGTGSAIKPAALFVSAYHAREVATPEIALRLLRLLADDHGRDPLVTHLVETRDLWIVPVVNPDGYIRVEAGAEWWRKNANLTGGCGATPGTTGNPASPGVDLNRNHAYAWNAGGGASTEPCGETYQGPSAVSEPETQAVQRLIETARPTTLITWHQYGNLVLWPWGHKLDQRGADPLLDALGGRLAAIAGYHGGPAGSTLYLTTGELTDWAWATHRVAAVTIEVGAGSDGLGDNPFTPPYRNVDRYWGENKQAALFMARVADDPRRAQAPDPARPAVTAILGSPTAAASVALTAGTGGPAAAAELFLRAPGVAPGAEGTGTAGVLSPTGVASWTFTVATLAPGPYDVWVRARDATGRWGPLNATRVLLGRSSLFLPVGTQRAVLTP